MIYLDYAATTPMSPVAMDAYQHAAKLFYGNSQSLHDAGSDAEGALEGSRKFISSALNVPARGLYFTGSGSEASFLALSSIAIAHREQGNHIITTQTEHSSVRNTCTWLESQGFRITRLAVQSSGLIDLNELKNVLREDTILVSIQHVNSETGVIQPLEKIGALLRNHQAVFHSDMVQSFGKLEIKPENWNIQSLSVSAHKIHGPKGMGACYISPSETWEPLIPGTTHERGLRPGTVNVPAVVAFAAAVKEATPDMKKHFNRVMSLKKQLIHGLNESIGDSITIEGDPELCSPYILGLRIHGMEGQFAMLECSQHGLGISTGSACRINEQKPSATLLAMARSREEAINFIRLSFDPQTTETEIEQSSEILSSIIKHHLKAIRK